jgi:hypothetical protein
MRLFGFLAVLSAALSAGAAQACCLFHFCHKSAPAATATAAVPAHQGMRETDGKSPYIEILSVNAIPPDSTWDIPGEQPSANVVVVVEVDVWTAANYPVYLYVTDLGERPSPAAPRAPATAAAPVAAPAGGAKGVTTKHTHVKSKLKFKPKAKAAAAPGAAATRGFTDDSDGFWVWELTYLVDCTDNHNYTCWAEAGPYSSHKVTFRTKGGYGGPPAPPGLSERRP